MESIYYVMCWLCHRTCRHCYEDRFRPYYGTELDRVVAEARANAPRIIANLPARMTYLDGEAEKTGRIILAGGEILLDPVREPVLYPAIQLLREKYKAQGGIKIVIQTTGDTLGARLVSELLDRGVFMVSVSGMDSYHEGMEIEPLTSKLTGVFESLGMKEFPDSWDGSGPYYHFFGATPDSWIGSLWPRGRACQNELSTASLAENFCDRWSGGRDFLKVRHAGSEVSIEPNGNVYPCCIKTKKAIGNLLERDLESILADLTGNPVYEAISAGHPERMGLQHDWSVDKFLSKSRITLPSGRSYENLCIGCDAFHEEVLMRPDLVSIS